MVEVQETTKPYKVVDYKGLKYGYCRDFDHISRYKGLRQISHIGEDNYRFIALETVNLYLGQVEVIYHTVSSEEENRLDIIAQKFLGSAQYSWAISTFNGISDGFTAKSGEVLKIPKDITSLFKKGEVLASISPFLMNLGEE